MSHATVMIKVTEKRLAAHGGDIKAAVEEMMAPYDEGTEDDRYRVFEDVEPEYRPQYNNESVTKIRTPDGDLVWPWDERYRVPGTFGTGSNSHRIPDDCREEEVRLKDLYRTFDEFMTDYAGYTLNQGMGKYGHYTNPNKTWDWYQIGGRWRGFFPIRPGSNAVVGDHGAFDNKAAPGRGDVVRLADIDMDAVAFETRAAASKFWRKWQDFLDGEQAAQDPFDGPRMQALKIGLLRVEHGPALSDHCQKAIPWAGTVAADDPRSSWHDVAKLISEESFLAEYLPCFSPLKTYAALDNDGWHAPGKMGWFGCSSDDPGGYVKFAREFASRFITNAAPEDTLVLVDYHI